MFLTSSAFGIVAETATNLMGNTELGLSELCKKED